jgi:hypothetical protein
MNASGYESACTSTEERLIVNMKFPNRRSGARVRISRALTKKSKECKKLQEEINELQKKYKRTLRSWQRMKKKTSDIQPPNTDELSASMTSTESQSMTPRSNTKLQITEAGLSTKQSSMVKNQLLLGNVVQSQLNSTRKEMRPSHVRMLRNVIGGRKDQHEYWLRAQSIIDIRWNIAIEAKKNARNSKI